MKKKAQPEKPIHKMGKTCGYELFPDLSFQPAPAYQDRLDAVIADGMGIRALVDAFNVSIARLTASQHARQQQLWDEIREDYGMDIKQGTMAYDRSLRRVVWVPQPKQDASWSVWKAECSAKDKA